MLTNNKFVIKELTDCLGGFKVGDIVSIDISYRKSEDSKYDTKVTNDVISGFCNRNHLESLIGEVEAYTTIEINEEYLQNLLEIERKYLILVEECKKFATVLQEHSDFLSKLPDSL